MSVPLLAPPERRWWCPNCEETGVTREPRPHTQFHHCRGLLGMWAPMVPAEVRRAAVVAHEREDYVGDEDVRRDGEGRPIMSVTIEREDGVDCVAYAPTARFDAREYR